MFLILLLTPKNSAFVEKLNEPTFFTLDLQNEMTQGI